VYELYRRIAVRALTPVLSLIVLGGKASIMVRDDLSTFEVVCHVVLGRG